MLWKDKGEGCWFACNFLFDFFLCIFFVPLYGLFWLFTTHCDNCGGTNWSVFGQWKKYYPPS